MWLITMNNYADNLTFGVLTDGMGLWLGVFLEEIKGGGLSFLPWER